jgi:hypothetical protein
MAATEFLCKEGRPRVEASRGRPQLGLKTQHDTRPEKAQNLVMVTQNDPRVFWS